jgi:hypothetical protein
VNLGNANVSCYVAPPVNNYIINVYECGTCTQIGTGRIAPFGDLSALSATPNYVKLQTSPTTVGLITGGTSTSAPTHTVVSETTYLDCASACV